ncbi:MAG: hypothetical protein K2W95_21195 [Candidatus Obscuribacterales bacterium]|nr:hypothetical protein [Candidatus Obscuribacterales bacterium]
MNKYDPVNPDHCLVSPERKKRFLSTVFLFFVICGCFTYWVFASRLVFAVGTIVSAHVFESAAASSDEGHRVRNYLRGEIRRRIEVGDAPGESEKWWYSVLLSSDEFKVAEEAWSDPALEAPPAYSPDAVDETGSDAKDSSQ